MRLSEIIVDGMYALYLTLFQVTLWVLTPIIFPLILIDLAREKSLKDWKFILKNYLTYGYLLFKNR